ncbi:cell division protein ZapA [Acetobacteraceae bacterium KSS8]|uniref:Cell division protein ZapA n=1 Tax=Endosaccharibacter trunci TaxID=2812733 RepID=A0ABT1WB50_9PROT|nr:cell division protein ZapA [Acetobacteraceae bacterium KSS8]
MAQVVVKINGYAYAVGCEDGQEQHLQSMASQVERRIERIKAIGGQSGEARLLALAALLMADELHDLAAERLPSGTTDALAEGELARAQNLERERLVNRLAERAEAIAMALERD